MVKLNNDNCLATVNPELSKEWHLTKNGELTPNNIIIGFTRKVWWKCEKGHEWEATINNRHSNKSKCPYCSGKKASKENCLATLRPEVSKEWHPTKNGTLTPYDVTCGSNKKVWWVCEKGHEWKASINNRNAGKGCPKCKEHWKTSFPELAIFYYLKKIFSSTKRRFIFTLAEVELEVDIYISELNLAIEYDGYFYHKSKKLKDRDELKNNLLQKAVKLIRIREKGLPKLQKNECII